MTPAELMACTKDVSRVAEGESNKKLSHTNIEMGMRICAAEVQEGKYPQVCAKVNECAPEIKYLWSLQASASRVAVIWHSIMQVSMHGME